MSLNHFLFYGVYLVCEGKREIEIDGALACPEGHHNPLGGTAKFCTVCGTELVRQKELDLVSFSDFEAETSQDFIINNYGPLEDIEKLRKAFYSMYVDSDEAVDVLVPTNKNIFGVHFIDDEGMIELPYPKNKAMATSEVEKILHEEINCLRKYIYKKVTVMFGSISNWS